MQRDHDAETARRHDERIARTQEQLKTLAWLLDSSIRLPGGFRIGVDPLIGLVPFFGDAAGVVLSAYLVTRAAHLGVPRAVVMRMIMNVAVEGVVGLVPLAGDVFDAAWKANQRNVRLLERHLGDPVETARSSRRLIAALLVLVMLLIVLMSVLSALTLGWIVASLQG